MSEHEAKQHAAQVLVRMRGFGRIEALATVNKLTKEELKVFSPERISRRAVDEVLNALADREKPVAADVAQQPPAAPKSKRSKPTPNPEP